MDARAWAVELQPQAAEILEAHKADLIGDLPWARRKLAEMLWPWLLFKLFTIIQCVVELLAARFGRMTLGEVAEALAGIRKTATYVPRGKG
jgi:hypothetical protein